MLDRESDALITSIKEAYRKILGRELYLSYSSEQRILSFIEKALKTEGLTDEQILQFYEFVLEWYKQKGYRIGPGHLCSRKILSFIKKVRRSIADLDPVFHRIYNKAIPEITPPYDTKLRHFHKFAIQLLEAQRVIYVPRAGYVLETGLIYAKQAHGETNLWKPVLEDIERAYEFYLSLRQTKAHRDFSSVWRKKPYWKCLIPIEYFNSPIGPLTYSEALLLIQERDNLKKRLTKKAMDGILVLKSKVEQFGERFHDYLWMLPGPRKRIARIIESLCFGGRYSVK